MFGQINKITAAAGKRDDLIALVMKGSAKMHGCRSYLVSKDANSSDVIWVTEVWDNAELHAASMDDPNVKSSVEQAMPMIVGFETIATTIPVMSA